MMTAYYGGLAELLAGDGGVALIFMAGSLLVTLAVFIGCGILARRNLEKKGYYKPKLWLGYFAGPLLLLFSVFIKPREYAEREEY